jgi:hypothetical protein
MEEKTEMPSYLFVRMIMYILSGTTYSSNNITTTGANIIYYAYIDEYDAFLVKFNANGTRV